MNINDMSKRIASVIMDDGVPSHLLPSIERYRSGKKKVIVRAIGFEDMTFTFGSSEHAEYAGSLLASGVDFQNIIE